MSTPLNDPIYAGRRNRLSGIIQSKEQFHIDPVDYICEHSKPKPGNPCVTDCSLPSYRFPPPSMLYVRGGPTGVGMKEGRKSIK
jgi:hypothetical protein